MLGCWLKKSHAESCAVAAWGISLSPRGLTAWMRSGKRMASWMKKTGMLLPTMSGSVRYDRGFPGYRRCAVPKLPSSV